MLLLEKVDGDVAVSADAPCMSLEEIASGSFPSALASINLLLLEAVDGW